MLTRADAGFCRVIFEWDSMDVVYSTTEHGRSMDAIGASSSHAAAGGDDDSEGERPLAAAVKSIAALSMGIPKANNDQCIQGFPDVIASVDMASMRAFKVPQRHALGELSVVFLDFFDQARRPLPYCPRSTLKAILARLARPTKEVPGGIVAKCGIELEWYTYNGDAREVSEARANPHATAITSGMFGYSMLRPWANSEYMSDILKYVAESAIEMDCFHTETGPGVYEMAIKYCEALRAADQCQLFKHIVKTVAYHHKMTASFMAKPWNSFPGCGGHIHISLYEGHGKDDYEHKARKNGSLFAVASKAASTKDEEAAMPAERGGDMSPTMRHFIAGILHCLPDIMPFLAPNVNSYKRLDIQYWAPVIIGWGQDNRLAVVRVILSKEDPSLNRIEVRAPGADMNPYFAIAAILAAGHYGIEQGMALPAALDTAALMESSDPAAVVRERGYVPLPSTLAEATSRMMAPKSMARVILPSELIDHFGVTRLHELKTFNLTVTDFERKRYLELA